MTREPKALGMRQVSEPKLGRVRLHLCTYKRGESFAGVGCQWILSRRRQTDNAALTLSRSSADNTSNIAPTFQKRWFGCFDLP